MVPIVSMHDSKSATGLSMPEMWRLSVELILCDVVELTRRSGQSRFKVLLEREYQRFVISIYGELTTFDHISKKVLINR